MRQVYRILISMAQLGVCKDKDAHWTLMCLNGIHSACLALTLHRLERQGRRYFREWTILIQTRISADYNG